MCFSPNLVSEDQKNIMTDSKPISLDLHQEYNDIKLRIAESPNLDTQENPRDMTDEEVVEEYLASVEEPSVASKQITFNN